MGGSGLVIQRGPKVGGGTTGGKQNHDSLNGILNERVATHRHFAGGYLSRGDTLTRGREADGA
jgi:hypothetical protein